MRRCLIGHTGFVGGNLLRLAPFDACYNSKNIQDIRGQTFDLIVCAGAPGAKWKANRDPQTDWASLRLLMDSLAEASATSVVLISSIDVYPVVLEVYESSPIAPDQATPYGRHRKLLEDFVSARFQTTVLRLPGLFGPDLRKNVIYDLINDNCVDAIDPASIFQFYNVERLWEDIQAAARHGISLLNVATEPICVDEVARECFGRALPPTGQPPRARYDMRSNYARLWGRDGWYLYGRDQVIGEMKAYVTRALEEKRVGGGT